MLTLRLPSVSPFFFFNDTATTEIYTLSLHDALPISWWRRRGDGDGCHRDPWRDGPGRRDHGERIEERGAAAALLDPAHRGALRAAQRARAARHPHQRGGAETSRRACRAEPGRARDRGRGAGRRLDRGAVRAREDDACLLPHARAAPRPRWPRP